MSFIFNWKVRKLNKLEFILCSRTVQIYKSTVPLKIGVTSLPKFHVIHIYHDYNENFVLDYMVQRMDKIVINETRIMQVGSIYQLQPSGWLALDDLKCSL